MVKTKVIEKIDNYMQRCNDALEHVEGNAFDGYYVSFSIFEVLKSSVISFFNQLGVDPIFTKKISSLNHQAPYEVETIREYLSEVKDLIENDIIGTTSIPVYKEYDVFLSHANKDKETFVRELKNELYRLGINVFYDGDSIQWGDNWETKINESLNKCEFAIVVLSKNFFGREWTEKELNFLLDRTNNLGQKLILPILHGVSVKTISKKYPRISTIQSIQTSNMSAKDIAILFASQLITRLKGKRQ